MSKAILILDMPSEYGEDIQNGRVMIDYSLWHLDHKFKAEQNFHNAQLKPMPEIINPLKVDVSNLLEVGYMYGRNDLIYKLEGEEE